MREHDLELIAALVEGRLDDESEARALIASSDEAREEFEAQKLAYQSLREMGTASLTDIERAALHRDLWTQLNAEEAKPHRTGARLYRWVSVAAGLVVVVGLAAVLSGGPQETAGVFEDIAAELGGGGEGADPTTTAADGATTNTFAAAEEADGAAGDDTRTDTTEAASEGTFAPMGGDEAAYAVEAARLRQEDHTEADNVADEDSSLSDVDQCVDPALHEAGFFGYEIYALIPDPEASEGATSSDEPAVAVALREGGDPATATLVFVDLDTCEVVYIDE